MYTAPNNVQYGTSHRTVEDEREDPEDDCLGVPECGSRHQTASFPRVQRPLPLSGCPEKHRRLIPGLAAGGHDNAGCSRGSRAGVRISVPKLVLLFLCYALKIEQRTSSSNSPLFKSPRRHVLPYHAVDRYEIPFLTHVSCQLLSNSNTFMDALGS